MKITLLLIFVMLFSYLPREAISAIYDIGPAKMYKEMHHVPFDDLEPGDQVNIHYRKEPYKARIILRRSGTSDKPIVIRGIPYRGIRPVLDGNMSTLFQKEDNPSPGRYLIKVGDGAPGDYIHIMNLTLRNANNTQWTIEKNGKIPYTDNAAGVWVIKGNYVTISNCLIYSCGNGVLTWHAPDVTHLTLIGSILLNNGNHADRQGYLQHNAYLGGSKTIVESCYFGKPYANGQNLKDRGQDTIIRYNWIEEGNNRQLDLVEYKGYKKADAYVYGNVIIQGLNSENQNMIYYGGEGGQSRSGTLYLFNNTIIGHHPKTRYVDITHSDCKLDIRNNVFFGSGILWNGKGIIYGFNNWISNNTLYPAGLPIGIRGDIPGFPFSSEKQFRYFPLPGSDIVNTGSEKTPLPVEFMPRLYGRKTKRPMVLGMDIGAFEYSTGLKMGRE